MGGATKSWAFLDQPDTKTVIPNKVMQVLITGRVGDTVLTPSAIRVYLALRSRAYLRKREATEGELMAVTELDKRTVRRALMELWEVGLIEVGTVGYWAPLDPPLGAAYPDEENPRMVHPMQGDEHPMPGDVHPMQGPPRENAVPDDLYCIPESMRKKEEKNQHHQHPSHGPAEPVAEEEEVKAGKAPSAPLKGVREDGGDLSRHADVPTASGDRTSPGHVKQGTKPLQEALKRVGLWRGFYRIFRPSFAREFLWIRYLRRLEAEALPLGEAFLQAVAKTLEGAARGVVRHPTAYLEALLREVQAESPPGQPSNTGTDGPGQNPHLDGRELLLPDGRRGYFAGWTHGGRKGFLEVDGVALCLAREVLLALPVVG